MNGRKGNNLDLHRTGIHGDCGYRYGVMRSLDVHLVRTGNMWIVQGILILAVIVWYPWKGDKT